MKILKAANPQKKYINLTVGQWEMSYYVSNFVELVKEVIICYSWDEIKENPPHPKFYYGCTIWCYDKKTKKVKWVIEEPPFAYNDAGEIWNRGLGPYDKYFKKRFNRDECYLNLYFNEKDNTITTDTTGSRRFSIDPDTGKVTLVKLPPFWTIF